MLSCLCFRDVNLLTYIDLYLHNLSTVAEESFKGKKLQRRDKYERNMNKSERFLACFGVDILYCQ